MLLSELFETFGAPHGFPGTGQRLFLRGARTCIASFLAREVDDSVLDDVVEWACGVLEKDDFSFDEKVFKADVEAGRAVQQYRFQQRHFYYMAEMIEREPLQRRIYLAHVFGDLFSWCNVNFQYKRWWQFCGVPEEYQED